MKTRTTEEPELSADPTIQKSDDTAAQNGCSWTDTHAHLEFYGADGHIDEILASAATAGVQRIIAIGDSYESSAHAVKLAESHDNVWAAVGVHPNEATHCTDKVLAEIRELASSPRVVAIGESGLDYYRDMCPHSVQRDAFVEHIRLAKDLDLPLIIHNREADIDVFAIIEAEGFDPSRALIHCFTSTQEVAELALEKGFFLSFAGPVTFGKGASLLDVAASVPLDRMMVETDSPFLAPDPHRGRTNEPSLLVHTGNRIAEARGMSPAELSLATSATAAGFFGLPHIS